MRIIMNATHRGEGGVGGRGVCRVALEMCDSWSGCGKQDVTSACLVSVIATDKLASPPIPPRILQQTVFNQTTSPSKGEYNLAQLRSC